MRKFIVVLMLVFLYSVSVNAEYVNSKNGLNVRENPKIDSKVLTVLHYGDDVTVVSRKDKSWWKIILHDKTYGYVCSDYLQEDDPLDDLAYLGTWRITAYAATGNPCANGNYPSIGYTVACNSLPFGTRIYIDGVGERVVEDRGPSSLGDAWCDLYLGDTTTCIQWGNQYRDVYLVSED